MSRSAMLIRRAAYGALVGGGLALALWGGETGLAVLIVGILVMVPAAILSYLYLVRIYRHLETPRPTFFRMLLDAQWSKITLATWVGWLTVSRLSTALRERGTIDWSVPAPGPEQSAPISALVVIVALTPPVYYALRIMAARRTASRGSDVLG